MNWLIIGAGGMLGQDLVRALINRNVFKLFREDLDITNLEQVRNKISGYDVVVNCAAYTAVDDAESNRDGAFKVNAIGPENLARATSDLGSTLVHISTDYVFSGDKDRPYSEEDHTNPQSIYGESKLAGENVVLKHNSNNSYILRTAWLYGKSGKNFGKTILNLAKNNEQLNVVADQVGQPTWTNDLSEKIVEIVDAKVTPGIYNCTSSGETTWCNYAKKIFALAGLDPERINPVSSDYFPRPAARPAYSVLSSSKLESQGISPIQDWESRLSSAFRAGVFND